MDSHADQSKTVFVRCLRSLNPRQSSFVADQSKTVFVRCLRSFGIATVLDPAAEMLARGMRPGRFVPVFGSEGHGISTEVMASCDRRIAVPMQLGTDSVNVATAAALFLYEFRNGRA